jgi:Tfp pilus assembly protein PilN
MASEVEIAKNQVEITNLKTDIQKIDQSIEKIGEATSQISKLLAVHDNRLDDSEQTDAEIKKEVKVLPLSFLYSGQSFECQFLDL